LETTATERALSKEDEKRHPSRSGRIKKTRKKLESTATERALSKKGCVENIRLHGSNKASWSLIYLD
jgi:hypothetical protein